MLAKQKTKQDQTKPSHPNNKNKAREPEESYATFYLRKTATAPLSPPLSANMLVAVT